MEKSNERDSEASGRNEKTKGDKKKMKQEKEYCENCKKEITDEMKDKQQVIYASAEHTLYACHDLICLGDTDEMFSGVFCCQNCYNEISGINRAYKKGLEVGKKSQEKLHQENLHLLDLVTNLQKELKPHRKKKLKEIENINTGSEMTSNKIKSLLKEQSAQKGEEAGK